MTGGQGIDPTFREPVWPDGRERASIEVNRRGNGASAAAIQQHYDVGNEFYALWLDPSLTYSCGLWYADEDLATAQINKLDWHLEHAGARGAKRLLDVGCGWGSLLRRAVQSHGVEHGVGLSLSAAQLRWIESQPSTRMEVRLEAWQDHVPAAPYDAIVSIGAFEHFARLDQPREAKLAAYREFFRFCHGVLVPGSRMTLQTIVYGTADRSSFSPFFAESIFPESDLPHPAEIVEAMDRRFAIEAVRNDGDHYARTARAWRSQLRARRAEALSVVGAETVAKYEKYLGLLVVGFHTRTMDLMRFVLRRIDGPEG